MTDPERTVLDYRPDEDFIPWALTDQTPGGRDLRIGQRVRVVPVGYQFPCSSTSETRRGPVFGVVEARGIRVLSPNDFKDGVK